MNQEGKVKIGKIIDAHGIKGEISIFIFSGDTSWLSKIKSIYISKKNTLEKHQIIHKRVHKKGFVCLLENFNNRNLAEEYKGREVWVDQDIFISKAGEALYLSEILGFEIIDETLGSLGKVSSFSSNGIQDLLIINRTQNKTEIEIPFVKEFVKEMDFENKKIKMILPEGLLEINDEDK